MQTPISFQMIIGNGGPYQTTIRGFSGISPYGKCYFLDTVNGSNGNDGRSSDLSLATLDYALDSKMIAGDSLVVAPGSSFTLTAARALSLANISLVGVGNRNSKPQITVAGAVDGLSLAAAGITLDNFHFNAPSTDEATAMINVAAAGCTLRNITGIGSGSSKNFVDCITIAAGADDLLIDGLDLYNSNTAVNSFLSIEAAVNRLKIHNSFCFGDVATGGLIDSAKALQIHLYRLRIGVLGTTMPAVTLDSNPTGLAEYCFFAGTHTTLATNGNLGNLMRLNQVFLLEETDNSKQGVQIPAVDAD